MRKFQSSIPVISSYNSEDKIFPRLVTEVLQPVLQRRKSHMQSGAIRCSYIVIIFSKCTLYAVVCSPMRVWNSIGNRVYVNSVTRVQIPSSLPEFR